MPKFIDLQGRRFGRLIVLYRDMTGHSNDRHTYWICRCDWFVGEQVEVFGRKHNQQKKNFCDRCGQMIDWEGVNSGE